MKDCGSELKKTSLTESVISVEKPVLTPYFTLAIEDGGTLDAHPPNGGLRAWLQVLTCFIGYANSFGMINTFGAFQAEYATTLLRGATASQISWIGSTQAFLLFFPTFLVGPLFDKGHVRLLFGIGSGISVVGMLLTSFASTYWQIFLNQGVVMGIGFGFMFVVNITIIPTYFTTRKAFAQGLGTTGANVGGLIYTLLFSRLVTPLGLPWTIRIMALIMLITSVIGCFITRARIVHRERRPSFDTDVFDCKRFLLLVAAILFGMSGLFVPFFYSADYAKDQAGFSDKISLASFTLVTMNIAGVPGRILPGLVGDRFGVLNTMFIVTTATAMLAFVWMGIHNVPGYFVWSCFYGAFGSAFLSLQGVAIAEIMRVKKDLRWLGTWVGFTYLVGSFGVLVGGPAAGALLKRFGWVSLQAFAASCMTMSSIMLALAWWSG